MSLYSELNIINTGDYTGMINAKLQKMAKDKRQAVMAHDLAVKVTAEAMALQQREQRESDESEDAKPNRKDNVVFVHDGYSTMIPMPLHLSHKYTTAKIKSLIKRRKWPPSDYKTPRGFENQRNGTYTETLNESIKDDSEDYRGRPFTRRDSQASIPLQKRSHRI
jgi:hypothetical protein